MLDAVYVAGTIVFFALMIAYVGACGRLGDASRGPSAGTSGDAPHDARSGLQ